MSTSSELQPQPPTKILLLGAGELGSAFLPHLTSLPRTHITLGVRNLNKYTYLTTTYPNLSLTPIDLSSPSADLAATFSTYSVLISATGFTQDISSVKELAEQALAAGKLKKARGEGRLWFFPWQWGIDYDIIGDGNGLMPSMGVQKDIRNLLRAEAEESNVKWTIVSVGMFMSFILEPFWGIVDRSSLEAEDKIVVRCLRDWDHGVTVTDVNDIGKILARIVAGDVDGENRLIYAAGDSTGYGELADLVAKVTGKEVVREKWSMEHLEEELRKDPDDMIKRYRVVFGRDGVRWPKEGSVNSKLGIQTVDLENYMKRLLYEKN